MPPWLVPAISLPSQDCLCLHADELAVTNERRSGCCPIVHQVLSLVSELVIAAATVSY